MGSEKSEAMHSCASGRGYLGTLLFCSLPIPVFYPSITLHNCAATPSTSAIERSPRSSSRLLVLLLQSFTGSFCSI